MSDGQNYSGTGTWSALGSPNTNPYLPPEIWEKIFSNLQASDLLSVCDTCPEWNELMASEKISALIELALPLLNLNLHDTLTCREVSKGVKKAVDNQLATFSELPKAFEFQPEKSILRRNFNNVTGQISNTYNFTSSFRGEQSAQHFLSRFGEIRRTPYNPFLTRSFAIHSKFKEDKDCIATERILTLFGHNLWHLTIYVNSINMDDDDDDDDEFLEDRYEEWVAHHEAQNPLPTKKLARLLHLAPNLKTLSIATECRESAIIEELSPNELPELPHLTSLSFNHWLIEPSLPFVFLRRYGPQLIHLVDATNRSLLQLDDLTVENLNNLLPKLTKLQIRRAFSTALPKLANVNWNLEGLTIGAFYKWSTKDFFDIMNNFGPSLVQLHITDRVHFSTTITPDSLMGGAYKELSNLKTLSLSMDFVKTEIYNWFWKSAGKMFGHLQELHFNARYEDEQDIIISLPLANQVFQKLQNLDRILHWSNSNGRRTFKVINKM